MKFGIKRLDIYRKVPQDLTEPTLFGAIISLLCVFLIISLLIVEFKNYLTPELINELFVESDESSPDRIPVHLNISLISLICEATGLDIQDSNGRHEVGFVENTSKVPINGGAGCRLETEFFINKVPGNFHVSTHSAKHQPDKIEMAHIIHSLRFGDQFNYVGIPGGFDTLRQKDNSHNGDLQSHEFHLKIVPSIYENNPNDRKYFYQYTYAYKSYSSLTPFGTAIPAIWFRYDLTPITIKYKNREKHFYSFITMIFAVIGGTFTVAGIVNSIVFSASNLFKKFEIGKLN